MMNKFVKRLFDFSFSLLLLIILWPLLLLVLIFSAVDTGSNGFFVQKRVGQYGKLFNIYKVRTYHKMHHNVSRFGLLLRGSKLDELPQLINVLVGDMSMVGPRPDIEGYYDKLEGEDRLILNLKPGITSEASIKYRKEDQLLSQQSSPLEYNDTVIFPDKVKMNMEYYRNQSFIGDLRIIIKTLTSR